MTIMMMEQAPSATDRAFAAMGRANKSAEAAGRRLAANLRRASNAAMVAVTTTMLGAILTVVAITTAPTTPVRVAMGILAAVLIGVPTGHYASVRRYAQDSLADYDAAVLRADNAVATYYDAVLADD